MTTTVRNGHGPDPPKANSGTNQFENISAPEVGQFTTTFIGAEFDNPANSPDSSKNSSVQNSKIPSQTAEALRALGRLARSLVGETGSAIRQGGRQLAQEFEQRVVGGLDRIGAKPDAQNTIGRNLVKATPFGGPATTFADARMLWFHGKATKDEAMMAKARKQCLIAILDLKLDTIAAGTAKLVPAAGRIAISLIGPLYLNRMARALGAENLDMIDAIATKVCSKGAARKVTERLLDRFKPGTPQAVIEQHAPKIEQDINDILKEYPPGQEPADDDDPGLDDEPGGPHDPTG